MIRVAINGFGRIGRLAFREIITGTDFNIVAINSTSTAEEMAYLLKYDTVHGRFHENEIDFNENELIIAGKKHIRIFTEREIEKIPWSEVGVDLVLECTGAFNNYDDAKKHIDMGAKKVLLSAPGKGDLKTIVPGVNDNLLDGSELVVSASSCTTNCLAPVLKLLNDNYKIVKGFMTTIHAFTGDQNGLDGSHKKSINERRGRAASENIVPTTTGAASGIGKVIPELDGKLDGMAIRVPVSDGSLIDVVLELEQNPTIEDINNLFINNQNDNLKVTNDPIVSSDVIGKRCGALVDLRLTKMVEVNGKKLYKIIAWYDNELGYTYQMLKTAKSMFK